ncbi:serine hydrolase domain-containing protein [Novosphingobium sp.]|uniref:serine hydrolase domain-containing protein n=1 Tax=Novosphingobium sp. TaxID=1874826 RepID=UPI003BAD06EC
MAVDVWLDSVQAFDRIPSLSAAIVQGDRIVWSRGYGTLDAARSIPSGPDTVYSICSISKLFTSISLMQLWEKGLVKLDEPITTYLPWAKLKPVEEDSLPITLRSALTHSAGLPRESDFPYWTGPGNPFPTHEQIVSRIGDQQPLWEASRRYQYSNLGLTLVGETVAAVSGVSFGDYSQSHVLEPLGLKDTHPFMPMPLYGKRLAVGWGAIKRDGTRDLLKPFDTRGIGPAAGYTSTVEDLGRFAIWQFRLLRSGQPEVLKASTLAEMQRVQFTDPDWKVTRGLGFQIRRKGDSTYVGHSGDCPGYHTALVMRPATETAVVGMLTGAEQPSVYADAIFELLDKRKAFSFKGAPPVNVDLAAYTGRYGGQPWTSDVALMPWAGGLAMLSLPSTDPAGSLSFWKPKGNDIFRRVRDDGSEADDLRFERDAAGKVVRYIQFSNPREKIGTFGARP